MQQNGLVYASTKYLQTATNRRAHNTPHIAEGSQLEHPLHAGDMGTHLAQATFRNELDIVLRRPSDYSSNIPCRIPHVRGLRLSPCSLLSDGVVRDPWIGVVKCKRGSSSTGRVPGVDFDKETGTTYEMGNVQRIPLA